MLARTLSPPPKRPPGVVLGRRLAKVLRATVGDRIFLVGQTLDGASTDVEVKVRGILHTGTETYDRRVYLHIADLQRFIRLPERVHEIAAVLRASALARATRIAANLRAKGLPPGVVVQSWSEIRPDMRRLIDASRGASLLMALIIMLVAVIGVVNTMLMSVFERTREFGVLKAIGMSGARILSLIVIETLILAAMAALVGTLLGAGLDLYLLHYGINLTGMSASFGGVSIDPIMRAAFTVEGLVAPASILLVSCLIASLYPALRAARLRPAVGMRD